VAIPFGIMVVVLILLGLIIRAAWAACLSGSSIDLPYTDSMDPALAWTVLIIGVIVAGALLLMLLMAFLNLFLANRTLAAVGFGAGVVVIIADGLANIGGLIAIGRALLHGPEPVTLMVFVAQTAAPLLVAYAMTITGWAGMWMTDRPRQHA
jgi:hypothetical protein